MQGKRSVTVGSPEHPIFELKDFPVPANDRLAKIVRPPFIEYLMSKMDIVSFEKFNIAQRFCGGIATDLKAGKKRFLQPLPHHRRLGTPSFPSHESHIDVASRSLE